MRAIKGIKAGSIVLCILFALIDSVAAYVGFYRNPAHKRLADAGIVEKQVQVGDVCFNYAEGPDHGPALVLLHAQLLDWFTYSKVLPELSQHYHVYAIDYPGHGKNHISRVLRNERHQYRHLVGSVPSSGDR